MAVASTIDQTRDFDQVLLSMSDDNLTDAVRAALRTWQECTQGNYLPLVSSLLAKTKLVDGLLPAAAHDPAFRGRAVGFLLHWAMTTLKPAAVPSPEHPDESWWPYIVIHQSYELGASSGEIANELGSNPATIGSVRRRAERSMAAVLRSALDGTVRLEALRTGYLTTLFDESSDHGRAILAFLAVLTLPISPADLMRRLGIDDDGVLSGLLRRGLVVPLESPDQLAIGPELRAPIRHATPVSLRLQCHRLAAALAQDRRRFVEAAHHLLAADDAQVAAQLLMAEYESIVDAGRIDELTELVNALLRRDLTAQERSLLRLTAGQAAMRTADVSTALGWYRDVLAAADPCLRAYAMYLMGKATQAIAVEESIHHLQRGIELLAAHAGSCRALAALRRDLSRETTLFDLHLGLAWIYIQEKPDSARAKLQLQQATTVLPALDKRRETDLHNGWAGLFKEQGNEEQVLDHRYRAWAAAQETESADLQIMTAHNLGQACIWNGEFDRGEFYVQQAIDLAIKIGDRQREAKCRQTMGVRCFFQEHYAAAVSHYTEALEILQETGNLNWIAWTHHDLAEAYISLGETASARTHMVEAEHLATQLRSEQLVAALAELQRTHPALSVTLDGPEAAVMGYVRLHGAITNRATVKLLGVSSRTANRILTRLVKAGLLVKIGQGRSVRYALPNGAES